MYLLCDIQISLKRDWYNSKHKKAVLSFLMSDYFIFPVNFNDLEQEAPNHNRHRVQHLGIQVFLVDLAMSDRDIIRRLKNIDSTFNENYEIITDPDNFDFLYSLIKFMFFYSGGLATTSKQNQAKFLKSCHLRFSTSLN